MHPRGLYEYFTIINPFLSLPSGVVHRFGSLAFNIGSQHTVLTATSVYLARSFGDCYGVLACLNKCNTSQEQEILASKKEKGLMNVLRSL